MISELDPSLAPKLIKPNQWDRLTFTLASGKKKCNPCLSWEAGSNRFREPGRFYGFVKKICTLIMEMGGNPEKRCSIMRGWDIVFVHTAGKTLLK